MKMSDKEKGSVCSDQYEMVPPEGGWGYLVCVGLSVIFVSITSNKIKLFVGLINLLPRKFHSY